MLPRPKEEKRRAERKDFIHDSRTPNQDDSLLNKIFYPPPMTETGSFMSRISVGGTVPVRLHIRRGLQR
jgi:hypothetical protein